MLIRMKQSPPPSSSVWFCRCAALTSPAVTLLWRITQLLCFSHTRTGRNHGGVRKGSGKAVSTCVYPRHYLYLRPSLGTDVAHHLSSLFPGGVTLTEAISGSLHLQYSSGTQEVLLFHSRFAVLKNKSCHPCRISSDLTVIFH